jgi:predicted nucleic acid-binding protein
MAVSRLFVDTWGWLVLANDRDPAFSSVSRIRAKAAGAPGAWVTTDYVLDETMTRLFAMAPFAEARRFVEGIFKASREGLLDIEHMTPERFSEAWRLRLRYKDKPRISFTDLTSFVVMRELGLTEVLTGDAHFEQVGMGFARLP